MNDKSFFAKLREESAIVPNKVRKFSKFLMIAGPTLCVCMWLTAIIMVIVLSKQGSHIDMDHIGGFVGAGLGIAAASFFIPVYIMLVGYVYGDARRRGMPAVPWVLLVLLIPNMIGFIVYFILRRGIFAPCSNCGRSGEAGQIYCSSCGHKLEPPAVQPQPSAN